MNLRFLFVSAVANASRWTATSGRRQAVPAARTRAQLASHLNPIRPVFALLLWFVLGVTHANAQANLKHAQVGLSYSFQVSTTPAAPSGTIYGATGLPTGLSINAASGLISGTPTTAGTYNGAISLTAGGISNNFNYVLIVDPATGTPAITSLLTTTATVGQAFTYSVTADNSPTSFNIGALPAGLAIGGTATAPTIAGTPTVAGTFSVALSANNSTGTGAAKMLILTVSPAGPVPSITSATKATGVPGTAFSYQITTDIAAQAYSAANLPLGLSINATTGLISGKPVTGETRLVTLSATNNNGTGPAKTLTLAIGTSTITSAATASGGVGVPFSFTLTGDRSPISFDVRNAPAWMTVNSTTGALSGTPTAAGSFVLTVAANNAAGAGAESTLTLAIGNLPLISSASAASATVGSAFTYTITASNSPTSFAATGLPGGLSLNPTSGVISGVPTASGTFSATLTATNGSGTGASFTLMLTVAPASNNGNGGGGGGAGGGGGGGGPSNTPPVIVAQPASQSVAEGSNVRFTVSATGALTYQWKKDDVPILGAAASILTLPNVTSSDAGTYTVTVTNFAGSVTSAPATLTVTGLLTPPVITAQPASQTVAPDANVTFSVTATGNPAPTYQWRKNGSALTGATAATLTLSHVTDDDAGSFTVVVTNSQGSVTSAAATLRVTTTPTAPIITTQPVSVRTSIGQPATFAVVASGVPTPTYQWQKDGAPIAGATGATLSFASVQIGDTGSYDVVVSNSAGAVRSDRVVLAVTGSRLVNFSVRANAGSGDQTLIVGFNIGGSGAKQALVRAVGPTLAPLGVRGALSDPQLRLFNGTAAQINQNDDWGGAGPLTEAFSRAGAFALPASSKDAALSLALDAGGYSAQVSGAAGSTGVVLVEAYDVDGPSASARLANLSARNQVGTGENMLIAGFVITGDQPMTLLIRGVGPALAQFGVGGVLADPQLAIFDASSAVVAQNDNWGGGAELAAAFTQAGAFTLPATSHDAALLVTLPPGAYTVQLSGAGGGTGVGLIELYETKP